jgi:threonine synthase
MKDPDYIYKYHTGQLEAPDGSKIRGTFANQAIVAPNNADRIAELLG